MGLCCDGVLFSKKRSALAFDSKYKVVQASTLVLAEKGYTSLC